MKTKLLNALLTVGLTVAASEAQAGAVATAYLQVYNASLTNSAGVRLVEGGANPTVAFVTAVNNNGDTSASITGIGSAGVVGPDTPASATGYDVAASIVGTTGYTENAFTYLQKPTDAPNNYGVGDIRLQGALVNIGGVASPAANAQSLAEISLLSNASTGGTAAGNNVGVTGTLLFQALATDVVNFTADYIAYVRASLTADLAGTNADATISWNMSLVDLSYVQCTSPGVPAGCTTTPESQNYVPGAVNVTRSATLPGTDLSYATTGNATGSLFASFNITQGHNYQLTVKHQSDANASVRNVPEPMPILMMSLGLLGFAWTKRLNKI
jgi:hypothetical protein